MTTVISLFSDGPKKNGQPPEGVGRHILHFAFLPPLPPALSPALSHGAAHQPTRPGPTHPILEIHVDAEGSSIGAVHDRFVLEDDTAPPPGPPMAEVCCQFEIETECWASALPVGGERVG